MKKILIFVPIALILLSGCLGTTNQIITNEHHGYDELYLEFNLPASIDTRQSIEISYECVAPNGTVFGTYHAYDNLTVHNPNIVFDRSGIWHVYYDIYEGETKKVTGDHAFYIPSGTHHTYEFILKHYEYVSGKFTFTIQNVGREAGYVHILLYDDMPLKVENITEYGHVYYESTEYLQIGHEVNITKYLIYGAIPVLMYNEEVLR